MWIKFRTFCKETRVSKPNYYWNYCIRKRCLLKRLKGRASEHHSVINVLTVSKHCWNQHGTTIIPFLHEFEINWVRKSLPYSYLKSSDCLLTRWLPMTSTPVAICRISGNNFKRDYLKKRRLFLDFIAFPRCAWNLQHSEKKRSILAYILPKLLHPKEMFT